MEGGGQVVRITSALSALLGVPIRLNKIRAGRAKGGLAAQHAAGLRLVSQLCSATLEGAEIGSTTATLRPGRLRDGGTFRADAETAGATMLMLQSALPCCCFGAARPGAETELVLMGGTNVPFSPQFEYMQHVTLAIMRRVLALDVTLTLSRRGCFPRGGD
jgi:RNA 3'-terminal phosphate cyclase (ATP)